MVDSARPDGLLDPGLSDSNIPNFTNASRGYDSASAYTAKAITGAGQIIDTVATGVDNWFKKKIRDEATTGIDVIRDAHIDDLTRIKYAMGDPSISSVNGVPKDLNAQMLRLRTLGEARATGKVSDTQYYTQLDIMSRGLRAKYPGYREHIDNVVKDVSGVDPANKVIAELRNEIAGRIDPGDKEMNSLIDWASKNGHLPEDYAPRIATGRPYGLDELRLAIAQRTRAHANLKANMEKIAFDKASGQAVEDSAEKTARQGLALLGNGMLTNLGGQMGKSWDDLQKAVENAQTKGSAASPEDTAKLTAGLAQFKTRWMAEANAYLRSKPFGPQGLTFNSILPKEKVDAIEKEHEATIAFIEQAIINKDYGAVLALRRQNQLIQDGAENKLLTNPETGALKVLGAIKNVAGPEVAQLLLNSNAKLLTDTSKAVANSASAELLNGKPIGEILDGVSSDKPRADVSNRLLGNAAAIAANPNAPKEAKAAVFQSLYGADSQNVLNKIVPSQRMSYWSRMTSPQMATEAIRLREQGDTASWDRYSQWVKGSFLSLFKKEAADAQSIVTDRANIDLRFNSTTNQFEVVKRLIPKMSGNLGDAANAAAFTIDGMMNDNRVRESVNTLNAQIRGILPILKADGQNPVDTLSNLIKSMGIDTSKEKGLSSTASLMDSVAVALQKAKSVDSEVNSRLNTSRTANAPSSTSLPEVTLPPLPTTRSPLPEMTLPPLPRPVTQEQPVTPTTRDGPILIAPNGRTTAISQEELSAVPVISRDQDYDRLPAGTKYRWDTAPNSVRIK